MCGYPKETSVNVVSSKMLRKMVEDEKLTVKYKSILENFPHAQIT